MIDYSDTVNGKDIAVNDDDSKVSPARKTAPENPPAGTSRDSEGVEYRKTEDDGPTAGDRKTEDDGPTVPNIKAENDEVTGDTKPTVGGLYRGLVDDVPVKQPGYILFVCLFLFILLLGIVYLLGSKDGAYVFSDFVNEETEASLKDQVNELLDKVARLRAQSSYDSAYILLRDFHEKHPEESNVNRELGWHNMEKGLYVFAAEYYSLAEEVTPNNSRLNYYRGELGLRWGNSELSKTRTGAMSTSTKNKHISAAISNFEQSKDFFAAALKGISVYNIDSAKLKAAEAEKSWLSARYKQIAILSIKALSESNRDRPLLKKYHDQLTNLLNEASLSSDLKEQIMSRRADLMKEL